VIISAVRHVALSASSFPPLAAWRLSMNRKDAKG